MGIEDLNSKLYSRDQADDRTQTENQYEPDLDNNLASQNIRNLEVDGAAWQTPKLNDVSVAKKTFGERTGSWWTEHQKKVYIGGAILLVALAVAGAGWYWFQQFFSERNTTVIIATEEQVKSGEGVNVKVVARNENRTALENVKIIIELPEGFVANVPLNGWVLDGRRAVKEVGTVLKDQETEVSFPGKIFGNKGMVATFKAIVEYSPAKIAGVYTVTAEANTLLLSSPLMLQVSAPQELVTGQALDYEVIYKNESTTTFDNVRIMATFPEGFTFASSTPGSNARDVWFVPTFRPGDTAKIVVRGTLEGIWNEQKNVRFALGYESGSGEFVAYNEGSASTKIIASPLSIKQSLNEDNKELATPGQILSYDIQYQNNSTQGYRDAIVTMTFENPEFLDWSNLDLPQGVFNQNEKTITWKASEVPELSTLAPGATGNLTLSVPIIADFSSVGLVKNKAIVSKVIIDSPDIQSTLSQNKLIGSSTLTLPLGTLVGLQMYAYANDEFIETDGPLPPESGEKTEYIVRFRVTNPANDVTQGKLAVVLPGYMKFTGKKYPEDATTTINDRTNEATWSIGSMSPGASQEIRFQIEFSPGDNLIGKRFDLIQSATFTGTDAFTKKVITLPLERIQDTLSDNPDDLPSQYNTVKK